MKTGVLEKLLQSNAKNFLFDLNLGLEKEGIRVNEKGEIAKTPHPVRLGNKFQHPYITTDFAESQLELITKPLPSIKEAYGFLETLFDIVCSELPEEEFLWEQSAPPVILNEDDIKIAEFGPEGKELEKYREHLALSYGKKRQLYSGVHYNFSFSDKFLKSFYKSYENEYPRFEDFKNDLYLKICRQMLKNRWMIIQLLGASPATHLSLNGSEDCNMERGSDYEFLATGTSARTSVCGYRNKEEYVLDYRSVQNYLSSIDQLINSKQIESARELYNPIRIKLDANNDVSYLEIRMLDNFPFSKTGVNQTALYGIHYFILNSLLADETSEFSDKAQIQATRNHDVVACDGRNPDLRIKQGDAETLSSDLLQDYYAQIKKNILPLQEAGIEPEYLHAFNRLKILISNPEERPAARLIKAFEKEGFINFHMDLAKIYKKEATEMAYRFHGLEDLELSTQLLLKDTLRRGIEYSLEDRASNFISLAKGGYKQYVQQATKTSLDNYASILMMENKIVTKNVLLEHGLPSPSGNYYNNLNSALNDFEFFKNEAIVIKPNSTNFGLGITILKENNSFDHYKRAVEIALEHDHTILIEEFISGKEYRVFLIKNKVVGILHRVPANVIGDGNLTIAELIDLKNTDPLRGKGYKTPLEKINKGEAEAMFLETQGLSFESIPENGQTIFLRENSNISTGGDSVDFTDEVHPTYKEISERAAEALGVEITGLDLMIDDLTVPAIPGNHSIIELNFNPAIHIHCYPYIGKNRRLNEKILDALGF
ncbi:MAG: bifunctional glutamate--cysteine ligase GshA/glutathione synthetase GshB [Flavobacteriaceae bacterium]